MRQAVDREANLERAAEIRYGQLPELEKQMEEASTALAELQADKTMLKEEVDEEDIAEVVSRWTGVPLNRLMEGESTKLLRLEEELHQRVIGQHAPSNRWPAPFVAAEPGCPTRIARSARSFSSVRPELARPSWPAPWPTSCLTTSGPWSVSTCRSTWRSTPCRASSVPLPAMSAMTHGGQLTEAVRRRPYAVVLLDEVEKAHPDVFNVLLQLMDDGRLTDGQGRTVDFTNVVLIMTSNLPGDPKDFFRPEFINRVDDIVRFAELTEQDLVSIVDIQLASLTSRLTDRRISLDVSDEAKALLARIGFDPAFGARPLKRVIQKEVADRLALLILDHQVEDGAKVEVTVRSDEFSFDVVG